MGQAFWAENRMVAYLQEHSVLFTADTCGGTRRLNALYKGCQQTESYTRQTHVVRRQRKRSISPFPLCPRQPVSGNRARRYVPVLLPKRNRPLLHVLDRQISAWQAQNQQQPGRSPAYPPMAGYGHQLPHTHGFAPLTCLFTPKGSARILRALPFGYYFTF